MTSLLYKTKDELIDIICKLKRKIDIIKITNKKEYIVKNKIKYITIQGRRGSNSWNNQLRNKNAPLNTNTIFYCSVAYSSP